MIKKFHSNLSVSRNHKLNTWNVIKGGKVIFTGTEQEIVRKFPAPKTPVIPQTPPATEQPPQTPPATEQPPQTPPATEQPT